MSENPKVPAGVKTKQAKYLERGDKVVGEDGAVASIKKVSPGITRNSVMLDLSNGQWTNLPGSTDVEIAE